MPTNLYKPEWTALDQGELRFPLLKRIGRPGQYDETNVDPLPFSLSITAIDRDTYLTPGGASPDTCCASPDLLRQRKMRVTRAGRDFLNGHRYRR